MSDSQIKSKTLEEEGSFMGTSNIPKEDSEKRSGCTHTDVDVSSKHIPAEIFFSNILTRIPVKSILRFSSVSTDWGSVLRSSFFCKMHLTHSQMRHDPTHLLVLVKKGNSSIHQFFSMSCCNGGDPVTHLLTVSKPSDYTISDNINGLSYFYPSNGSVRDDECAYICNPSTREIIILPPSPMGFDVSHSFGVDPFTNIFKVLGIHNNLLYDPNPESPIKLKTTFYTISSHSRSWRQIHPVLPSVIDDRVLSNMNGKGICVNGMIHWMLASKMTILTFCLRDEKFGLMPLPKEVIPPVNDAFHSKGLIQIGGYLAFTPIEWTSSTKQLWILKDHRNQVWVKKSITVPFSDWTYGIFPYLISSVHTDKLFFRRPGFDHVVCYDMKTKTFRRFQLAQLPKGYKITVVTTYLESLLSLRDDWTGSDGVGM